MNVRNYIHLTGNLGAAPTTFVLPSGGLTCRFSLATNEYYRNKEGEKVTRTEWHVVKAYGKLAELFVEHLDKGSQISIVGSMRYRKWEDKFGQKRITPEVTATEFTFLSSSRQAEAPTAPPSPAASEEQPLEFPSNGISATAALDAEVEEIMAEVLDAPPIPARRQKKMVTRRKSTKKTA